MMEEENGLSKEELQDLILEQLDEMGVAPGTIDVRVLKAPKVVLEGKVDSDAGRRFIVKAVQEIAGTNNVIDELIVAEEEYENYNGAGPRDGHELYDEDNEYVGSEDVFRAVEDGVPYIPPTSPPLKEYSDEQPERVRKKRRKPGRSS
jgi:hypothetical protein